MKDLADLYRQEYQRFLAIARKKLRPGLEPEDVLAAALVGYMKALTQGVVVRNPVAFLTRIIQHEVGHANARHHITREKSLELAANMTVNPNLDLTLDVRTAVGLCFAPGNRLAVWLHFAESWTVPEIAARFPIRTARQWSYYLQEKARPRLKSFLSLYKEES